jgi:Glycosyl transferase 4-like domain
MARILSISFSDLARDPRVSRQIDWMAERHEVSTAGTGKPGRDDLKFIPIHHTLGGKLAKAVRGIKLLARFNESVYWNAYGSAFAALQNKRPDLIVANDLDALPIAVRLAERAGSKVLYDAHEYAPREFDDSWRWRIMRGPYATAMTKRYAPRANAMTTVGVAIAQEFERLIGVRPEVITNAPSFDPSLTPSPLVDGKIRLVHHGAAIASRKIENMIAVAPHLDERFELSFQLVENDPAYAARLRGMAKPHPQIRFLPPAPMRELPQRLNPFDLGIYLLEPTNFNNKNALPNKFFEFLQGRLGIVIGPTPEMARIVRENGCGTVANDFRPESLAKTLNALTGDDVARFKQAAHAAAQTYSAETNREKWMTIVDGVLN